MKRILLLICLLAVHAGLFAQQLCDIRLTEADLAFHTGEKITYAASYTWGPIFTDVGEVILKATKLNDSIFHARGDGRTYKFYDKFFKVRDVYESRFSLPGLRSVYFHRDIFEGDYTMKNTYNFDWEQSKIKAKIQRQQDPEKNIDINLTTCTLDVLTYFYYLRCLDFSDAYPNKTYTVSIALDEEVYSVKFRYLGKESKKIKAFGVKVNCLKFAVEVIAGSVFKGDEKITMWVSNDRNHIPLELESPIKVGKVKGRILKFENLKYPLNLAD